MMVLAPGRPKLKLTPSGGRDPRSGGALGLYYNWPSVKVSN